MKNKQSNDSKDDQSFIVCTHHEASRDYFILETFEAGMALVGCEVKSLREKKASLAGSFVRVEEDKQVGLYEAYIASYPMGNRENPEPKRKRKLLLHKNEIERLLALSQQKGLAIIPLKIYFKHGLAKILIATAKGKKFYDKREDIKAQEAKRRMDRAIKHNR